MVQAGDDAVVVFGHARRVLGDCRAVIRQRHVGDAAGEDGAVAEVFARLEGVGRLCQFVCFHGAVVVARADFQGLSCLRRGIKFNGVVQAVAFADGSGVADLDFVRRGCFCGDAALRVFVVSGVVFVRRLHGNFVSGVVFTECIGAAVGLVDGLAVA